MRRAYTVFTRGEVIELDEGEFGKELLLEPSARKAIDGMWKSVNAVGLVRTLLTQKAALARAANEVLEPYEQALLLRPRAEAEAWTAEDLPLIDEAEARIKGVSKRFGHVVVDEAQDLSPMQLRMLARRARHNSMTVLGDLAQATGAASPSSWEQTLIHLGDPANAERADLTMGYRLPGEFLALANRLLPMAAPGVAPSRSVRADGDPADVHECAPADLVPTVAEHALVLAKEFATVGVLAGRGARRRTPARDRSARSRARRARRGVA